MLTDTKCRTAKPKDKPYKLADEKGLYLEVKPNGAKAWRYRFELVRDGVRKEGVFAIGDYVSPPTAETPEAAQARRAGGQLTLAEAREERIKARALVKQGVSPVQNRRDEKAMRERESATTFEGVAREWLGLKDWTPETKARRLDTLSRVVFPKIGAMPVKAVKPVHVLDVLTTAARTARPLRLRSSGPCRESSTWRFPRCAPSPIPFTRCARRCLRRKTQHKRPLAVAEIGQLLRDLAGFERNFQTVAAMRLMWWTLCRPGEAVEAQWSEFDLTAPCGASLPSA